MVAPEEEEVFWVLDFVGQQETYRLQRLLAPVHVVAQEKVVGLGWEAAVLKEPQQIVELTVDIACKGKTLSIKFNCFHVARFWTRYDKISTTYEPFLPNRSWQKNSL